MKPIIRFLTSMRPTTYSFIPPDNGNSWVKIKIPEGIYETDDINNTILHEMEKRGHYDPINEDYYISANSNTLKSVLILEKDYQVDFNNQNSIAKDLPVPNIRKDFTSRKMLLIFSV